LQTAIYSVYRAAVMFTTDIRRPAGLLLLLTERRSVGPVDTWRLLSRPEAVASSPPSGPQPHRSSSLGRSLSGPRTAGTSWGTSGAVPGRASTASDECRVAARTQLVEPRGDLLRDAQHHARTLPADDLHAQVLPTLLLLRHSPRYRTDRQTDKFICTP